MAVIDKPLKVEIVERHQRNYPVDVRAMADDLGLYVEEQYLPDTISGMIKRNFWNEFTVVVNDRHSETRKRFTIAHEIAHYVLHRDMIGDGVTDDAMYRSAELSDAVERQANRYAASVLMPHWLVRRAWMAGTQDAKALGRAFRVSPAVAEIRIDELGCRYWPS
ncbi:ImmA/IrrE family metallo-endopeptidase [Roseibium sp.]|uniref:ImmA/IrrE family metallo-endopeptidase n=1 Tax=Roseibium sp. TaxID=1936156 RepID=UPI003271A12B